MLEEKPQKNTDLKRTSQGWDVLLNKTRIRQDFSKGAVYLISSHSGCFFHFLWKYFLAKQYNIGNDVLLTESWLIPLIKPDRFHHSSGSFSEALGQRNR